MKIALPSRNNNIDDHFGRCEYFSVLTVDTEKKTILGTENVDSPEGCGCKSNISSVLADMGVELMIAGNMGDGAVHVLNNAGIGVIRGCSGPIADVAQKWLNGEIKDSGIACHAHEHECHHED